MLRFITIYLLSLITLASSGGRVDTTPDSLIAQDIDSFQNLELRKSITSLKIGDSLKLDSIDEYILKTNNRYIHLNDYKLVIKYNVLKEKISDSKNLQNDIFGEVDTFDIINDLNISVKPFNVDDF